MQSLIKHTMQKHATMKMNGKAWENENLVFLLTYELTIAWNSEMLVSREASIEVWGYGAYGGFGFSPQSTVQDTSPIVIEA